MAPTIPKTASQLSDLGQLKGPIPLIGLTGGIGSGKTAVSELLGEFGAGVVDTDLIAHQITAPHGVAIPEIRRQFGNDFIDPKGALNREKMRALVFSDPQARKILEGITHPLIQQATIQHAKQLSTNGAPYLVFVVPLLIESGSWLGLIDRLVVVDCPEELQITRVMQRSNFSREEVQRILEAQASREDRLRHADIVIENQSGFQELKGKVNQLHEKILQFKKDQLSSS